MYVQYVLVRKQLEAADAVACRLQSFTRCEKKPQYRA